jgi:hypothetical protein
LSALAIAPGPAGESRYRPAVRRIPLRADTPCLAFDAIGFCVVDRPVSTDGQTRLKDSLEMTPKLTGCGTTFSLGDLVTVRGRDDPIVKVPHAAEIGPNLPSRLLVFCPKAVEFLA